LLAVSARWDFPAGGEGERMSRAEPETSIGLPGGRREAIILLALCVAAHESFIGPSRYLMPQRFVARRVKADAPRKWHIHRR